jgi:hypothetical protein
MTELFDVSWSPGRKLGRDGSLLQVPDLRPPRDRNAKPPSPSIPPIAPEIAEECCSALIEEPEVADVQAEVANALRQQLAVRSERSDGFGAHRSDDVYDGDRIGDFDMVRGAVEHECSACRQQNARDG